MTNLRYILSNSFMINTCKFDVIINFDSYHVSETHFATL